MAYSKEIWDKAKCLYELGKSLQEIADDCNFKDKTTISRRAKKDNWEKHKIQQLKTDIIGIEEENTTLEAKKTTAVQKLAKLQDYEITILDKVIQDETGNKSLLFSTANLSLIRKNQLLTKNTKTILSKEDYYEDGKKIMTKEIEIEIPLSPNDLKSLDEGIEVNAKSLEIAPRHANSQINVNTQNNMQQNTELNKEIVSQTLEAFNNEY